MDFISSHKERSEMILEPLQVMIQLAITSFCPIGTKLSVSNNILRIQRPVLFQGLMRWWNDDNRDDLYYLFHAIRRYYKWYKSQNDNTFNYILALSMKGIDKLMITYNKCDKQSITHTLSLYKNVLDLNTEELFKDTREDVINMDKVFERIITIWDVKMLKSISNIFKIMEEEENENYIENYVNAVLMLLTPIEIKTRNWIHDNLTV